MQHTNLVSQSFFGMRCCLQCQAQPSSRERRSSCSMSASPVGPTKSFTLLTGRESFTSSAPLPRLACRASISTPYLEKTLPICRVVDGRGVLVRASQKLQTLRFEATGSMRIRDALGVLIRKTKSFTWAEHVCQDL